MAIKVNNRRMSYLENPPRLNAELPDVVIGAGVGGICAAITLASAGRRVLVLERAATLGGKMRALPSASGPVDTGPTVLTLKDVFEGLFARAGAKLSDYVTLIQQPVIARHFWHGGAQLDLSTDTLANEQAIGRLAGAKAAAEYRRFDAVTRQMYDAFDAPMMRARRPQLGAIAAAAAARPAIWPALLPFVSLQGWLSRQFTDPRLVQLFGRYATYVGGAPSQSPAVLGLIWQAESAGVWAVQGGMSALATGLERLALRLGVTFQFGAEVAQIIQANGRAAGVALADGAQIAARSVTFNGDPAALRAGLLGAGAQPALPRHAVRPRSLSAYVWAFAAEVGSGAPDLAHHNVFFGRTPARDWGAIARGRMGQDPTLYICAQDRGTDAPVIGRERFEIIMNAAPIHPRRAPLTDEAAECHRRVFSQAASFGLTFHPSPSAAQALTTPQGWAALFPASAGAIYGRSPQSLLAPMLRPTAQTRIKGLYLAGGGVHPGAGVPMAALSGQHAAAAILSAPTLICAPPQAAMRGGMSMG